MLAIFAKIIWLSKTLATVRKRLVFGQPNAERLLVVTFVCVRDIELKIIVAVIRDWKAINIFAFS